MSFASTKQLLEKAHRKGYAVGAFNINNMEMVQGIARAARKLKSPVILATSEGALAYAGMDYLRALAETAAKTTNVPIALHLDHGKDLSLIKKAIQAGYSSVMIDASHESFEKNIRLTKNVVQSAHRRGISVEAELGTIGGAEDLLTARQIMYTNPDMAKEFVERTNCDFLAVAIGTSHGAYKFQGKPHLKLNFLQEISRKVKIPLVLHGASGVPSFLVHQAERYGAQLGQVQGVPDLQLRKAVKLGICKVNTDTDLRIAFDAAVRKAIATFPRDIDPRHILKPARDAIQKVAEQRMRLFWSVGKA